MARAISFRILYLGILWNASEIQNVVAPYQYLTQVSRELPINILLCISQLQIHIRVDRNKISFVFHTPLKFDNDRLPCQVVQERFWVNWNSRHSKVEQLARRAPPLRRRRRRDGAIQRHRPPQPTRGAREAQAQEEAPRAVPQLILHGCQVPGMLQHNNRVQPLPDCCCVPRLPNGALPAHRREGQAHRGLLLPPEGRLECESFIQKTMFLCQASVPPPRM